MKKQRSTRKMRVNHIDVKCSIQISIIFDTNGCLVHNYQYYKKRRVLLIMTFPRLLLTQYLGYCRYQKNLDEKTLKAYAIDLRQYHEYCTQCDYIGTTREDISMYLVNLHGNFKAKTVKRKIASLKAFFFYCEEEGCVSENPFSRLKIKYNEPRTLPKTIPVDILQKVLQTAYKGLQKSPMSKLQRITVLRDIAILETLFATGVRVSELCTLSKRDMNLEENTVRIMGKGDKERIIQITNDSVINVLKTYVGVNYAELPNAPVFRNRYGKRITEQSVRGIINKYAKQAGVDMHITPHMFRHTFATLLLEEDVDIRYIQNLLGHSSISTTQIYTHVSSAKQKQILELKHPRNKLVV